MDLIDNMAKIAVLLSNTSSLGKSNHKTGISLLEIAPIVYELERADHRVEFISITGGAVPIDLATIDFSNPIVRDYYERKTFLQRLEDSIQLENMKRDFDALVACGGWNCIGEFIYLHRISEIIVANNFKHIALLGYATSLLLQPLLMRKYAGTKITGPSPQEDQDIGFASFYKESIPRDLTAAGYQITFSKPWSRHIIDSGELLTGQNVQSAQALGELLVKKLNAGAV